jgi:hypothetical protein
MPALPKTMTHGILVLRPLSARAYQVMVTELSG